MADSRVVVIGAAGFLGGTIGEQLRASGTVVLPVTRADPLLDPAGRIREEISSADAVVWAVGSINPALAQRDPSLAEGDLTALQGLLDGLETAGSKALLVHLSSGGTVYDPALPPPYAESSPLAPLGRYGAAKVDQEHLVSAFPNAVTLRVSNAYGPGQRADRGQGVLGHWLRAVRDRRPITVIGPTSTTRDYVHAVDIANAVRACLGRSDLPPVLNIGAGAPTTLQQILECLRESCPPFEVDHADARPFDVPHTWLDIALADDVLGWRPRIALAAGLREWFDWLCADPTR